MAVSAVVADWSGARYLDGIDETLEEYLTQDRVEANMNTEDYALTDFTLNIAEGVTVNYRGKDYKFTVEITSSGNSAKVTYGSESEGEVTIPEKPEQSKVWTQEGNTITDGEGTTLQLGDYINYDAITGASKFSYESMATSTGYFNTEKQVFNLNSYEGKKWRIFGVDDGKIQIISEDDILPDIRWL